VESLIGDLQSRPANPSKPEVLMHLIWTILIGFVVGLIAKAITPGSEPGGFFLTAALGVGGSLAATYLGQFWGWYQPGQSAGFIGAVVGAIILLGVFHLLTRN
jgi:uncharacterized membrane protein YeaQ/YmgE (transglycosylase-associated protein family)